MTDDLERPDWVNRADPIPSNGVVSVATAEALRHLAVAEAVGRSVHESWAHQSTRTSLLNRGLVEYVPNTVGAPYVRLTDDGRLLARRLA